MASYLVVHGDNPNFVTQVEGRHIKEAIETLDLEDGESVTVYRMAGGPRNVTVKSETVKHIEVN